MIKRYSHQSLKRNDNMNEGLCSFISSSKSQFDVVNNTKKALEEAGYKEIKEYDSFSSISGKVYITRNSTSIIAMNIPKNIKDKSINIISAHTDSPSFKLCPNACQKNGEYHTLMVEPYGGAIYSSWFDRSLGVAGRVVVRDGNNLKEEIISIDDIAIIPNLCIHFNRDINKGHEYNPNEMRPIISNNKCLYDIIAERLNINKSDIISYDLSLYACDKAKCVGDDLIVSPRIDNLASCYAALKAFISSNDTFKVFASFDNEEVGSRSMQGAASNFMISVLERVYLSKGYTKDDLYQALARSIMISADNAHAVHPNYPSVSNPVNAPVLNKGFVIKYNSSLSYTTDAVSASIIKMLAEGNNIPYQEFSNRSDIKGGSTLGNILQSSISIHMVDIGLPQLAMHSAVETMGSKDLAGYIDIMRSFYNSNISFEDNKIIIK